MSNKYKLYLFVFSFCVLSGTVSYAENKDVLNLATGSEKGVYYALGQGIAEIAKKENIKIEVINSQGSQENLHWLSNNNAQLCLAQSDTVYNAYNGLGQFKEKISNIRAIASLYTEAVHILIRNPLLLKKIGDFKGKRISIGPEGSGTEANAIAILEAAGITPNEIQLLHLSFEDSIKAVNEGKVDIIFFTSGYPLDAVKIIMQNKSTYFFEPNEIIQRLIDIYPFFVITTIPSGTYANQDEDITTIGVAALLISRDDLDNNSVYNLTKLIFDSSSLIANYNKKGADINLKSALRGIAIPVHGTARQFYDEKGIYRKELYKVIVNYVLIALLVLLFTLVIIKFKEIKFFFKKMEIARVLVVILLIWTSGSIVLYYSEHKINENYSNLFLAFWSGLINWINFGGKEPYTFIGRITATIMMVLGVGSIAWFTGTIASIFVHKKLMGGRRMIEKLKNHYVIINWNNKGYGIIEQLHSPDLNERRPILLVTNLKESPISMEHGYEDVYHISDSSISDKLFKKINVHLANSIIILADDLTSNETDARNILIVLVIRKICIDMGMKQVPIVVEILEPQKVELARYVGISGDWVEIISSQYITQNLLAQAAATPGLTRIYEDLLTFSRNTSEIYSCMVPSKFIGKRVNEFFRWVMDLRDKNMNIIPIAISRGKKTYLNPAQNDIDLIKEGDLLFAICDTRDDLKKIENY